MPAIRVGDHLPNVTLFEEEPSHRISTEELAKGKKVVLLGVNGAFTPNCSKKHVKEYIENYDKFKQKGIDEIVVVAANDPYEMAAWGEHLHSSGKVRMLSDCHGDFCKAAGIELDLTKELGGIRCARVAMVVNDGVVESINAEPDGKGLTCSLAENVLQQL